VHDLKNAERKNEELEKQPKFEAEYADTAIHEQRCLKNIDSALSSLNSVAPLMRELLEEVANSLTEQSQPSKIEPKVEYRDRIVEKPQYIEKTVEKTVEKVVYKDRLEGLKFYAKWERDSLALRMNVSKNATTL
jgi:hypothetical protein